MYFNNFCPSTIKNLHSVHPIPPHTSHMIQRNRVVENYASKTCPAPPTCSGNTPTLVTTPGKASASYPHHCTRYSCHPGTAADAIANCNTKCGSKGGLCTTKKFTTTPAPETYYGCQPCKCYK